MVSGTYFPISGLNCICKFPFALKGNIFTVSGDNFWVTPSSNTAFFFSFCFVSFKEFRVQWDGVGESSCLKKAIEIPQGQWFILEAERVSLSHQGTSWSCRISRMVLWGMTLAFGRSGFQLQLHQSYIVSEKLCNLFESQWSMLNHMSCDPFAIS